MKQVVATDQPAKSNEPFQLFLRGSDGAFVGVNQWVCPTCMLSIGGEDAKERAAACCNRVCRDCGAPVKFRGYIVCDSCRRKADAETRAQRLATATEVADWSGPVFWDGEGQPDESTFGENWWESAASFSECWEADPNSRTEDNGGNEVVVQPVEFVFCGKQKQLEISLKHVYERISDEGHEDITESLHGEEELQAAVDAFNKLNQKALQVWQPDYTKKVRVPRI